MINRKQKQLEINQSKFRQAENHKCTCAFLNDGRFTFYRTPLQLLGLGFYNNSIIVPNLVKVLSNCNLRNRLYIVTNPFFMEDTIEFEKNATKKYSYIREYNLFVLLLDYDVNIHAYIEEPLFNMICNNLFISFG